ncbi:hypothetical protein QCA50_008737 [Cerrena zonata]|uniref:Extracellular serine-rich protein n=1 Tax=Cerrena zonata TaxID=2478898 RepID=A0AAW0G4D1_9APHY
MPISHALLLLILTAVKQITAQNYVTVGSLANPFSIRPPYVDVDLNSSTGIAVTFESVSSVIQQSTFENPCTWGGEGYFSYNYTATVSTPSVTIKFSDLPGQPPYWFFDAASDHCKRGMVFAVNPESESQFNDFRTRALSGGVAPTATVQSGLTNSSATSATGSASEAAQTTDGSNSEGGNDDGAMSLSASMFFVSMLAAITSGWAVL